MSRHSFITNHEKYGEVEVAFGYDAPCHEYFIQAFSMNGDYEEDDGVVFSIGNRFPLTPHPDFPTKFQYTNQELYDIFIGLDPPESAKFFLNLLTQ